MVGHPEPPILGFIEWLIENGYSSVAGQLAGEVAEKIEKAKPKKKSKCK